MNTPSTGSTSGVPEIPRIADPVASAQPSGTTPIAAVEAEPDLGWWTRRRMRERGWDETYRPAPLYKRVFAIIALGAISISGGLLITGLVATVIAAAAILLSGIVS